MVPLAIGELSVELHVPVALVGAVLRKYRDFARPSAPDPARRVLRLSVSVSPPFDRDVAEELPRIDITRLEPMLIEVAGECEGELDLAAMRGEVHGSHPLAGLDALLRLALSLLAPRAGWLLLHGAAIELVDGRWALLLGPPGSGKSTAARAFSSFCDELVLVRPGSAGCEAASTPYWGGRPGRAACAALVCLDKGREPGVSRLHGAEAVRRIAPHTQRPLRFEQCEERTVRLICELVRSAPVLEARCPTGSGYLPFLAGALAGMGFTPGATQCPPRVLDVLDA